MSNTNLGVKYVKGEKMSCAIMSRSLTSFGDDLMFVKRYLIPIINEKVLVVQLQTWSVILEYLYLMIRFVYRQRFCAYWICRDEA